MAIIVKTLTCIARTDAWTHICTCGQNKCMRTQMHAHSNAMCASSVGGFSVRTCSDADVIICLGFSEHLGFVICRARCFGHSHSFV